MTSTTSEREHYSNKTHGCQGTASFDSAAHIVDRL